MCYVTVVVQSRLVTFDRSLEEAAMDLGATPLKTFFVITLPIIAPALVGGWLLAFTLSLDDLVIASFTTGPGATTLPMRIYSSVRLGVTPEINAVCTVLIALRDAGRDHRLAAPEDSRAGPAPPDQVSLRLASACAPRERLGHGPDARDHRVEPVRPPGRQQLREAHPLQHLGRVVQDLPRRAPVVEAAAAARSGP